MLPDFALPIVLPQGPRAWVARDVPTGVFFLGFADSMPGAECFARQDPAGRQRVLTTMESWADGLLTRVVVAPRLTPELVQRMGDQKDAALLAYLRAVGWLEDAETAPGVVLAEGLSAEPIAPAALQRAFVGVPGPNVKGAIRLMASKCRVAPHAIWTRWAISEFIWTWRVLLQDDLLARQARQADDPMDIIGLEQD